MEELANKIRQEIVAHGPMPFQQFMELALYCPEVGYYDRFPHTVGRWGDYTTSVSVGSLLGELLSFQFAQWIEEQRSDRPQIVEAGAHDGRLAGDILTWLRQQRPRQFDRIEYWIQEPSRRRQAWQQETLTHFAPRVRWFGAWDAVPENGFQGVIFSNELLDAMPVRRIGWDAVRQRWFEWGVGLLDDRFVWVKLDHPFTGGNVDACLGPVRQFLGELPAALLAWLPGGFTTEINPAAIEWWRRAARALKWGKLLTIDYGLQAEEFLTPDRSEGTLRGYRGHRLLSDVLSDPGQLDLTAHVNFTAIQTAGEEAGLTTEGLYSQAQFLTRIAQAAWRPASPFGAWSAARTRQFQTLTHPDHFGRKFKVLIQSRSS